MKKLLFALAVIGSLAIVSCTKHACPAYGSSQKVLEPVHSERV